MKPLLFFFLLFFVTLESCHDKQKTPVNNAIFDQESTIQEVINATLPILLPDSVVKIRLPQIANPSPSLKALYQKQTRELNAYIKKHGVTVFFDSMLSPIDHFAFPSKEDGRRKTLIKQIKKADLQQDHFNFSAIHNYGNVKLISKKLRTPPDLNNHFGTVSFSKMCFHSDNKKVIFTFSKHYFLSCLVNPDEVIEAENQNGKWVIIYRK